MNSQLYLAFAVGFFVGEFVLLFVLLLMAGASGCDKNPSEKGHDASL